MLEKYRWLLKQDEVEYNTKIFKGKLAGLSYKYERHPNSLVRTRLLIFFMSALLLLRVLTDYLLHDHFEMIFLIERSVLSGIMLLAGLLFNKMRYVSIIIACLPLCLLTYSYFILSGPFRAQPIAFTIAMLLAILSGIYNHYESQRIREILDQSLLENQLIDN